MSDHDLVSYCGIYCDLCSQRNRTPKQAAALRETMAKDGYEFWGKELKGFNEFWEFLNRLSDPDKACPGCRKGGGCPFCSIRKCAEEKGIEVCALCEEYPCKRIKAIAKGYTMLIPDGERIREKGLDAWIEEQKERQKTGFCYADVRYQPYEVPRD